MSKYYNKGERLLIKNFTKPRKSAKSYLPDTDKYLAGLKDITPTKSAAKSTGSTIRNNIQGVLSKKYGELDTKNLFSGISDKDIEDNIETAQNTIQTSIDRGVLNKNTLTKLPNLKDGLTMYYAAGNNGNSKAMKMAHEAAYTESVEPLVKSTESKLLSTQIPKTQNTIKTTTEKPETKSFAYNVDKNNQSNYEKTFKDAIKISSPSSIEDFAKTEKKDASSVTRTNYDTGVRVRKGNYENPTSIYSGDIWENKPQEDLYYSDLNKKQLTSTKGVTWVNTEANNQVNETLFRMLGNITSMNDSKMNLVVNDMIDHFFDGTGTDYSHPILTEKVKSHKETQRYMQDFSNVFHKQLQQNKGNITELFKSDNFRKSLKNADVLLSKYDYYNTSDKFNGLTMAIHSWTESDVSVESFKISPDGKYSGILHFVFKDNFGLDEKDVEKYGKIPGFASWFTLQHNYKNGGNYKPFKTVVEIDYPISGKIEEHTR